MPRGSAAPGCARIHYAEPNATKKPRRRDGRAGGALERELVLLLHWGRHGAGGGRLHGLLGRFLVMYLGGLRGRGDGRFGSGGAGGGGRGCLRRGERQGHGGECQGKGQDGRFHFVFSPSRALSPAHNSILRFVRGKLDSLRRLCRPTKSGVSGLIFIRIQYSPRWGCVRCLRRAILITRCYPGRSPTRISSGSLWPASPW